MPPHIVVEDASTFGRRQATDIRSVSQLKFRLLRTSGTRASSRSASTASPPTLSDDVYVSSISASSLEDNRIAERTHYRHCVHAFCSMLATPILLASGIFGFGLRMRAR